MANVLRPVVRPRKRSSSLYFILITTLVGLVSLLVYRLVKDELDPIPYDLTPTKPLPTSSTQNNRLSEMRKISIEPHRGAESLVHLNGTLYTGTMDGKILRIKDSKIDVMLDLYKPGCDLSRTCARPLGMRLSRDRRSIIFVDAPHGIFSLSLEDGKLTKRFPLDVSVQPKFLDDIEILPNGNFLVSEASVKYSYDQLFADVMESRPNGRLLVVDAKSGKWRVLKDGIHFTNGVQLHRDGKSVLVAETTRARILRIPLDGKSATTVFADGLPGLPDNIRLSPRGGYWVPVSNLRDNNTWISKATEWSTQWPIVRRILFWLTSVPTFHRLGYTRSSMLLRLNEQGQVIEAWHDPENLVTNVAEVCEADGQLFTGSYFLPYIGRLKV